MPLIFSIDTSAPGGWPLRRIWSRKRRLVISSAISSTSTRVSRSRKRASSSSGLPSFVWCAASSFSRGQLALGLRRCARCSCARGRAGTWPPSSPCPPRAPGSRPAPSTSSKNTSFTSWPPSIRMSGRTVMPGVFMSISRNEMPSWRLSALGVGAHQAEDPVGVVRERGPDLLAVDDVVVALAHGARLQRREVGAGAGLRIALAPEVLAVVDARQEALLLRVGAEAQQHRRAHARGRRAAAAGAAA